MDRCQVKSPVGVGSSGRLEALPTEMLNLDEMDDSVVNLLLNLPPTRGSPEKAAEEGSAGSGGVCIELRGRDGAYR